MANLTRYQTPYRVGVAGGGRQATAWYGEEFGVDAGMIGNMTPEQCRDLAVRAQAMRQQRIMAKEAAKHLKAITEAKLEIERLRAQVLTEGLDKKAEIDKLVSDLEIKVAQHQAHIQELMQKTQHGVGLAQAKSRSALELGQNKFQNQLREIAARHQGRFKVQQTQHVQALKDVNAETVSGLRGVQMGAAQRANDRKFMDFISGRSADRPGSGGGLRGWFS